MGGGGNDRAPDGEILPACFGLARGDVEGVEFFVAGVDRADVQRVAGDRRRGVDAPQDLVRGELPFDTAILGSDRQDLAGGAAKEDGLVGKT